MLPLPSKKITQMKNTALTELHISLGAKMVPFAGCNMPVQYTGVNDEHIAVRERLGVFDVSHMGEFFVKGPGALALIQKVTSNDASKLFDGKVQYSCLPNDQGGIVDDLLVYKMADEEYMLVVNASNISKDWDWISNHNDTGAQLTDRSDQFSLLAVQGPLAAKAMQSLTPVALSEMEYYTFQIGEFAGVEEVIISATGYTGAGGFELYVPNAMAMQVWEKVMEAGKPYGIQPAGLACRDTLRLEMGFCLYGNDINDTTSPLEAGLGWITKFTKTFTNSANLQKQKEAGVTKKLVGFEMVDKGIPRHDYPITNASGEKIGIVTSGTMSPSLKIAIGMGYVPTALAQEGSEIFIEVREKLLKAKVVKLPFYKNK
jgi:aminomethyltransferase